MMTETEVLEGAWMAVLVEEDGRTLSEHETRKVWLMIRGVEYDLGVGSHHFRGVIDGFLPERESGPIDFVRTEGPAGTTGRYAGLFLLEENELTVCVALPGQERPEKFATCPGSGQRLYCLKRVAPEAVDFHG